MSDPFAQFGGKADDADPFAEFGGKADPPEKTTRPTRRNESVLDFADALSDAVTFGAADKVTDELSAHAAGKAEAPTNMLDQFARAPMAQQSNRDAMEFATQIEMSPEKRRRRMEWRAAQKAREGFEADRGAANVRRAERSPYASGMGTAVGIVAPVLLTGGAAAPKVGQALGEAFSAGRAARSASAARTAAAQGGTADMFLGQATNAERMAARAGRLADKIPLQGGAVADYLVTGGALTGTKAALFAASKAPQTAAAIKAALGRLAASGGTQGALASVVASGAIGLDRALDDDAFAGALEREAGL